ncbi:MAG: ABC transporter ATP-binding protein [Phormidesmis sp.]
MRALKKLNRKIRRTWLFLPTLRLVWRSGPSWTLIRFGLIVLQGLLPLASIYIVKLLVDALSEGVAIADQSLSLRQLTPLLIAVVIVALITLLCSAFSDLVNTAQTQKVSDYMRSILHRKSVDIDLEYYEDPQYHDTLQRAQQEATYRPAQLLTRLAQVGQNAISLVAMIGLLLTLHWGITGVLLVAAIPSVWVRLRYTKALYQWERIWTPINRQSMYLSFLLTGEQFAKEIRLFGIGPLFSQRFDRLRTQLYKAKLKLMASRSLSFLAANVVSGILIGGIYLFILYQALQKQLTLGDLVLYHQALQRGQGALKTLMSGLSGLYEDHLFLQNLYELLALKPTITTPAYPKSMPNPMQKGIAFQHVDFQYSGTTRQALKDISLTVRPKETIALVGENGSGKTTLIKLLCRLYDPTHGKITIDGIDIKELSVDHLRDQISVIFQDYAKYNLSAQDNIWLGNTQLPAQSDAVISAARRSGAHDVIERLPQKYDTMLGKLFKGGEELSIGQWQKVALARAFLRDSQVIVLDEPTSAMDPKAEYEVFKRFRELIEDQAAILVTHRLSTVKMADRIYVMDRGKIVESGCHEALIDQQGLYANLFETQARSYR